MIIWLFVTDERQEVFVVVVLAWQQPNGVFFSHTTTFNRLCEFECFERAWDNSDGQPNEAFLRWRISTGVCELISVEDLQLGTTRQQHALENHISVIVRLSELWATNSCRITCSLASWDLPYCSCFCCAAFSEPASGVLAERNCEKDPSGDGVPNFEHMAIITESMKCSPLPWEVSRVIWKSLEGRCLLSLSFRGVLLYLKSSTAFLPRLMRCRFLKSVAQVSVRTCRVPQQQQSSYI